jgi:riboflavin synthase
VDGVSLTITSVHDNDFTIAVIPYTWRHTVLHERKPGDPVNIEVDILAKYVERLLAAQRIPR